MAFAARKPTAAADPTGDALTAAMAGIGMQFASARVEHDAPIEETLVAASVEGLARDDLRVLAVLVTWFGVHRARVRADLLTRLVATRPARVRAFWSALAGWQATDRRFARLRALHRGPALDLLATGTVFQLKRHGEDPRFAGSVLRVPANVLRDRAADVLAPAELAARHRAYRWRLVIGPTPRADAWAALEAEPALSPSELARRARVGFATAWMTARDFVAWHAGVRAASRTATR